MSLSNAFAIVLCFSAAFLPVIKSSSFSLSPISEDSEELFIPPPPNFSPANNAPPSINTSFLSSPSPRSRSGSATGGAGAGAPSPLGRSRSGSATPIFIRMALSDGDFDAILALNPTEPLSNRGKCPITVLFDEKKLEWAKAIMSFHLKSDLEAAKKKELMEEFVRLAVSSQEAVNLQCVLDAFESAEIDLNEAFAPLDMLMNIVVQMDKEKAVPFVTLLAPIATLQVSEEAKEKLKEYGMTI